MIDSKTIVKIGKLHIKRNVNSFNYLASKLAKLQRQYPWSRVILYMTVKNLPQPAYVIIFCQNNTNHPEAEIRTGELSNRYNALMMHMTNTFHRRCFFYMDQRLQAIEKLFPPHGDVYFFPKDKSVIF